MIAEIILFGECPFFIGKIKEKGIESMRLSDALKIGHPISSVQDLLQKRISWLHLPDHLAIALAFNSAGIFSMAYRKAVRGMMAFFDIT